MNTAAPDLGALDRHSAHNYHPLPVVISEADGAWVTDVTGRRYLDALAAYSAVNFGHGHPRLIEAVRAQLDRVTLTSRAFHHDRFEEFTRRLAALCRMDAVLPMNTGAEAVETAIKLARRWGYEVKGVPDGQATIIVADNNFHGRTTTIVSFSTDPSAREGFGPYTPGFRVVPFGDAGALASAIDDTTVAVLIEPIQGEAGVIVPPDGYLEDVRRVTTEHNILMVADEIQAGLGRTGYTFACDREGVVPDAYVLGKALGGGIIPVSAVVSRREIMDVFTPGSHGSTFGGNPLAAAVAIEVIDLLETGEFQQRARDLGQTLRRELAKIDSPRLRGFRTVGLWAGVDVVEDITARQVCERLVDRGVLAKDTHEHTVRLAPPLVITGDEVVWLVEQLAGAIDEV